MKARIDFQLPEERMEFLQAVKSPYLAYVLWEIVENLWRKYEDVDEDECEASWRVVMEDINQLLADNNIDVLELNN
jgi:hypothetical protein